MTSFQQLFERAREKAGGEEALEALLPVPASPEELSETGDDRYLSEMSLRVFSAGLRHDMVRAKWPAFEEAFHGFAPRRVAAMSDEDLDRLLADRRLIRHGGKIHAVRQNAQAMLDIAAEHGSFARWLADWPARDIVGLWGELGKRFRQLGGNSGPYFLRMVGKDTFILTDDVVKTLTAAGIVSRKPTSRNDLRTVQEAFNAWSEDSGRPLCQVSRIAALANE